MLRIRFFRTGRKKQPFFKIVVTDVKKPPSSGRFVDEVGYYNPLTKDCEIKKDKVLEWKEKGAQISDTVYNLFVSKGIIEGKKRSVVSLTNKRREKIGEEKAKEEEAKKAEDAKKAEEEKVEEKEEVKEDATENKEEKKEAKEEAEKKSEEDPSTTSGQGDKEEVKEEEKVEKPEETEEKKEEKEEEK